jgi:hypothetical protein
VVVCGSLFLVGAVYPLFPHAAAVLPRRVTGEGR